MAHIDTGSTVVGRAAHIHTLAGAAASSPLVPQGGINVNNRPAIKLDLERAKTAGAKVVRVEELETNVPSLVEVAGWCAELGLKLCWITFLIKPGEVNTASKRTLAQQIAEVTAPLSTIMLIEHGNEFYPGGASGSFGIKGKQMGEWFCTIAEELATAKVPIPLGLELVLDPVGAKIEWTEEIGTVPHATLRKALEPTALLPTGNWFTMHPYGSKMTIPELNPNNIKENSEAYAHGGAEVDPVPGGGKKWDSQRWQKGAQLLKEWTGLTVPCAISEYGARTENGEGEEPFWKVASAAIMAEYMSALWEYAHEIRLGKASSGTPTGLVPSLALVIWYDQYRQSKVESYGIMSTTGVPFEPVYAAFKAGVAAL